METSIDCMAKVDSFILDLGEQIFIWNGAKTTRVKKTKALELSVKLNNENNGGKGKVIQMDEAPADSNQSFGKL